MTAWILLLVVLITFGVILAVRPLRQFLLSRALLQWFRRVLPPMSSTEQEAISAGDTWHEADLFQGNPKWDELLAYAKPTLTKQEQDFLDHEVQTLCDMLDDWKITHVDLDLTTQTWEYLKSSGFFGMNIPTTYGGLGFSALACSTVIQKVATKSSTASVIVMVPNSLGPAELLLNYGTDQQKTQYLQKLAKGIEVPCFGLTSPIAGSDAGALTDEGIVTRGTFNGQQNVLGLRLTWNKRYITLAPVATVIGLAIKVRDPEHLLGSKEELGITVVLVPTNTPGVETGKRHFPLNQPFMNGPTRGKDVFVPLDFVIGGQAKIGKGWQMLMECLAAGRGISLPAVSTATGKHCFATCGAYAKLRQQFGLSIGKFEGVAAALAYIGGYTYILEATRTLTLGAIDKGAKPSVVTAICKYHMTEIARKLINHAMDIHGGRGVMLGPRNYLGRIYEAIPVSITVEGANILTRCLIIFGQGAMRCHPYVLQEMQAVMEPDPHKALQMFDKAFFAHVRYSVLNFCKLVWHSLTCMMFFTSPQDDPTWSKYYQRLSFFSLALACCADMAMLCLGGALKRKENISARLGDVLSYLYMASAILKYNHDHGGQNEERPFAQWGLDYCLYHIQHSLQGCLVNFPLQICALPMRWLVFPFWRKFRQPSDNLELQLSRDMMQPSQLRDRLTQNCIPVANVEQAWHKMLSLEAVFTEIDQAVKKGTIAKHLNHDARIAQAEAQQVISAQDAQQLREFIAMQTDVLQVDEFTNSELTGHANG